MNNKPNKVFVSAYLVSKNSIENSANHFKALSMLTREDIPFQVVEGTYKDAKELTFVLSATNVKEHEQNLSFAMSLALLFGQESVLEVHNDDAAVLHYTNGLTDTLGVFTEVAKEVALKHNCYTYVPETGRYFVVK